MTALAPIEADTRRKHGSPADRGSADAYYERAPDPHKYLHGTYRSERIALTDPVEVQEYLDAYWGEDDRKNWGAPCERY